MVLDQSHEGGGTSDLPPTATQIGHLRHGISTMKS